MGNIISQYSSSSSGKNSRVNKIPNSLSDLLSDADFENMKDSSQNLWIGKFQEYLAKRDSKDEENLLLFLISYHIFRKKTEEISSLGKGRTSQLQARILRRERNKVYFDICQNFFNFDNPDNLISLSNQVLLEKLNASLSSKFDEESFEPEESLLRKAFEDQSVHDLEETFQRFLRQNGQNRLCLLSLL